MSFGPQRGASGRKKKMEGDRVIREFKLLPDSEAPIIGLPPGKTSKRLHFKHPPSNYFFFRNKFNLLQKLIELIFSSFELR